jgi:DNA primase
MHTLEGLRQRQSREQILHRHHSFQRLLRPLPVINPYEPLLSYPDEYLVVRRDHPKYLQLILAVAFLHQMQRPLRHDPELGDYLEATLDDIAIANELTHQAFGHSLADLSQSGRLLLALIQEFIERKAASASADKETFSRRELREAIHWGDTRLRVHLRELVELEYVAPLSGRHGLTYHYRILGCPESEAGRFLSGLKSVEQVRQEANFAGIGGHFAPTPQVQKRGVPTGLSPHAQAICEEQSQTPHSGAGVHIVQAPTGANP